MRVPWRTFTQAVSLQAMEPKPSNLQCSRSEILLIAVVDLIDYSTVLDHPKMILRRPCQRGYLQMAGNWHILQPKAAHCKGVQRIWIDMNARASGEITSRFTEYSRQANRDLIERSFNGTPFLKDVRAHDRNELAAFPEYFKCAP